MYTIDTVVGGGPSVGASATSSGAPQPFGVAVGAQGSLYISVRSANQVWVVNPSGTLAAVIGNGSSGAYSGDGGNAADAQLNYPQGVAVDSSGNIYIADTLNNRIRKVVPPGGRQSHHVITTVAGNGTQSYSGDGQPATSAELNYPQGVAVDSSGNIYIADARNNRIRKVTVATGIIATVAGNGISGYGGDGHPATNAELAHPSGVALDSDGNIYIADWLNNCIRKVTVSTGIISTVAGNGTQGYRGDGGPATNAELASPSGVALDSGNIYIAEQMGSRIRKVTVATGIIATVAGNGTFGYSGDSGPATSAELSQPAGVAVDSSGNIYIADQYNYRIRKVTVSTGIITTVAGNGTAGFGGDGGSATSAELNRPFGVAVDSSGNLYIADTLNYRDRKVTVSTGIITTVAGNGAQGYSGDAGPATNAELAMHLGVALDSSGNLYIADTGNNRIRKVTVATGVITTVAGNGTQGYSGDGGPATNAELKQPLGTALDSDGNLYIADTLNDRIRKVTVATGIITTVAGNGTQGYSGDGGPATNAGLAQPSRVAVDSSGNLYIADWQNNRIRKVTVATGIITTVAGNSTQGYSGDSGPATNAELAQPSGIALDSGGNIYIADQYNNRIRMVAATTGIITTVAGNGTAGFGGDGGSATSAELNLPAGVALDSSGKLYIADEYNNRIRRVALPAPQTISFGPLSDTIYDAAPFALSATASSGLPVTFTSNNPSICKVSGNSVTILAAGPCSITANQAGNASYSPAAATQSFTVLPAIVTAAIAAQSKVYDGTTNATLTSETLTGVIGADNVTLNVRAATFASKNVGSGITVTATGLSLGGAKAGDYQLSSATATTTASITPRPLTVAATGVNKPYDGTTAATVTLIDNHAAGDSITDTCASASFSDPNVGTGKAVSVTGISISGADAGNYTLSDTTASTTANITPAPASILLNGLSQPYTGNPITVTATTTPGGLSVSITYNGSTTAPVAIGAYAIAATIADPDYAGSASGTLNITEPTQTIVLQTVPAGLLVSVDGGAAQTAPLTVNLTEGARTPLQRPRRRRERRVRNACSQVGAIAERHRIPSPWALHLPLTRPRSRRSIS